MRCIALILANLAPVTGQKGITQKDGFAIIQGRSNVEAVAVMGKTMQDLPPASNVGELPNVASKIVAGHMQCPQ